MYAAHISIKVQNELAKKSIILSLKDWSHHLFKKENGLILRVFMDKAENQIEIFHVFENKALMEKVRKDSSNAFWTQIKEMGGQVSRFEGASEVEMTKNFKNYEINFK